MYVAAAIITVTSARMIAGVHSTPPFPAKKYHANPLPSVIATSMIPGMSAATIIMGDWHDATNASHLLFSIPHGSSAVGVDRCDVPDPINKAYHTAPCHHFTNAATASSNHTATCQKIACRLKLSALHPAPNSESRLTRCESYHDLPKQIRCEP